MERHALSGKQTLKQVRQLKIKPESDARQKLQHRDFGTKSVPNGAQFQPYRACTNDNKFLWRFRELQRFGAADDCIAVKFCERKFHRCAAGSDDDIFRFDLLCLATGGFNGNLPGRGDCGQACEGSDLVRFHQRAHTAVECLHDSVFALLHLREIDTRAVDDDAMLGSLFFDEHEMIARSQKRFAGDTADIQASAA